METPFPYVPYVLIHTQCDIELCDADVRNLCYCIDIRFKYETLPLINSFENYLHLKSLPVQPSIGYCAKEVYCIIELCVRT